MDLNLNCIPSVINQKYDGVGLWGLRRGNAHHHKHRFKAWCMADRAANFLSPASPARNINTDAEHSPPQLMPLSNTHFPHLDHPTSKRIIVLTSCAVICSRDISSAIAEAAAAAAEHNPCNLLPAVMLKLTSSPAAA